MVSASLAFAFLSAIVTPANGSTGACEVVVWPAAEPVMAGATAGSVSTTEAVVSTVAVA